MSIQYEHHKFRNKKIEFSKTTAPATTDDGPDGGYSIGSMWHDTTNDKSYICLDTTNNAAVWKEITFVATAGDGIDIATNGTISTDLKANGGLVIETTELAIDLGATSITGTLAVTDGGTGQTSYTTGDLLYASGSTAISKLADIATGNALISGGVGTAPSYGKIGLTTHVSGTLPVTNGGTGATTFTSGNFLQGNGTSAVSASKTVPSGDVVGTTDTQTISNKTLGGNLDANSNKIINLATPTASTDSATKGYVDSVASGLDVKKSVRLATTQDLDSNGSISGTITYSATGGTSSRGQITATLAVSDTFTVDSVNLGAAQDGTRILLKNQTTQTQNGIWITTISGTSLTLDRATDFDEDIEVTAAAFTFVEEGTVNSDTGWVVTTNDPITIGGSSGSNIVWVQFSGAGQIIAGDGLDKTGNTLSLDLKANGGLVIETTELAIDLSASSITGTLAATDGGAVQTSYTTGDLLYASGSTAISKLADIATGNALISGGVGTAPSYGKIGLTTHVSGTLPATSGGTDQSSYAVGDILYASTTSALSKLADVATGNALISGGVDTAPSYGKIGLTTHVSGTLPVANGGTGTTTLTGMLIGNGTSAVTALKSEYAKTATPTATDDGPDGGYSVGSVWYDTTNDKGYVLLDATDNAAVWKETTFVATAGDGIDIAANGTVSTNLKANGGLVIETTELAIDLSASSITGTLAAADGGTGQTSYTIGDLLYASGSTAISKLADIATGNALISGGVGTAPSYGKIGLTTHVSGTLPATSGGTDQSSYAVGDILYASTTSALSKLADIATGNALISGGVDTAPSYGKIGLTTHVSGTLPVANGGTGATTLTGTLIGNGTSAVTALKSELAKTTAPTATDDSGSGYVVGSMWIDTTNKEVFMCVDNTSTAAVWKMISDPPYLFLNSNASVTMSTVTPSLFITDTTYQITYETSITNSTQRFTEDTDTIKINIPGTYRFDIDAAFNFGTQTVVRSFRSGLQTSETSATASFSNIGTFDAIILDAIASGISLFSASQHFVTTITTVPTWIRYVISINGTWDTSTRTKEHGTSMTCTYVS